MTGSEEGRVVVGLEHFGDFHPLRRLLQHPGGYHEGHVVESLLQLVLPRVRRVRIQLQLIVIIVAVFLFDFDPDSELGFGGGLFY